MFCFFEQLDLSDDSSDMIELLYPQSSLLFLFFHRFLIHRRTAAEHYLSSSNYMDCISSVTGSNGCSLNSSLKGSDLPELFSKLGLGKYTDVFQQQEVVQNQNLFSCSVRTLTMGPLIFGLLLTFSRIVEKFHPQLYNYTLTLSK